MRDAVSFRTLLLMVPLAAACNAPAMGDSGDAVSTETWPLAEAPTDLRIVPIDSGLADSTALSDLTPSDVETLCSALVSASHRELPPERECAVMSIALTTLSANSGQVQRTQTASSCAALTVDCLETAGESAFSDCRNDLLATSDGCEATLADAESCLGALLPVRWDAYPEINCGTQAEDVMQALDDWANAPLAMPETPECARYFACVEG